MQSPDSQRPDPQGSPSVPDGRRANVMALVVVAVLAIAIFLIVSAMQKHNAVQACIDSGRRDCVPLSTD